MLPILTHPSFFMKFWLIMAFGYNQRNNDCKGGMMEEWHQKLHNNTSPDDVVICQVLKLWIVKDLGSERFAVCTFWLVILLQALIDYIKKDFDISVYWKTLNENGITKERLLSYDRAIHSEPNFRSHQKDGLLRDLGSYMRTLKVSFYRPLWFSPLLCFSFPLQINSLYQVELLP